MPMKRSAYAVVLAAALYVVIGLWFGELAAQSAATRELWRRLAWIVSGVVFAAQILYDQIALRASVRRTALDASIAAAIGAGGLAVAANVHRWRMGVKSIGFAIAVWPLITFIPAFLAALVAAFIVNRWRQRAHHGET